MTCENIFFDGSTTTDGDRRFSVKIRGLGDIAVEARKDGHWTHVREISGKGCTVSGMEFRLIDNVIVNVTYLAAFCTRNSTQITAELGFDSVDPPLPARSNVVHDLHGDMDFSFQGDRGDVETNPMGHWFVMTVEISGIYSEEGEVENCYAVGTLPERWEVAGEYLDHTEVQGEEWIIPPGSTDETSFTDAGSCIFPAHLSPTISIDVLGNRFEHTFVIETIDPEEGGTTLSCELTNIDDVSHTFEVYVDEAGFLHVWQVD